MTSGVRAAWAANSSGKVASGTGCAVSFHSRRSGVALRRGQNVQAPDRPVGCRKRRLEQTHQPRRHRLDAGAIEQVGGVLQNARYPGRRSVGRALLAKTDGEVELGGGGGDRFKRGGEPRQVKADRGVALERQHHLEQRMTGQRAGRVDDLDQPFERQLLMVVGGEIGGPHTGNQVAEARIAAGVGAQHQGVDEEPDQIVERTVGAARDRAPDRDVGAGAQPGEQSRETGLQHHEQADPAVAGQTHQSLMEPRPQRQRDTVAAMAGDRRPRPIGRQLELIRKTLERAGPERQLTGHRAVRIALLAQNLVLPQRVVGILHRQRRKLRGAATAARRVGATKIAGQRAPATSRRR